MTIIKSHRVFLSYAARCANSRWSSDENLFHFGPSGSQHGAGFNVEMWASLEGPIDSDSGWMLSEQQLHSIIWNQAAQLDHQAVHQVIPEFRTNNPTLENLAVYLSHCLAVELDRRFPQINLSRLRLVESDFTWVDILATSKGVPFFTRTYRVPAVHRHHNPSLSSDENQKLYNKCSSLHGHEYIVEITVQGPIDISTGLVKSRGEMDRSVDQLIIEPYRFSFLNDKLGNTSGEVITSKWSEILHQAWGSQFVSLIVRETRKNSFVEAGDRLGNSLLLL